MVTYKELEKRLEGIVDLVKKFMEKGVKNIAEQIEAINGVIEKWKNIEKYNHNFFARGNEIGAEKTLEKMIEVLKDFDLVCGTLNILKSDVDDGTLEPAELEKSLKQAEKELDDIEKQLKSTTLTAEEYFYRATISRVMRKAKLNLK